MSDEEYHAKFTAIQDCLRGGDNERVDLWRLRELALSPGGLLEPSLVRNRIHFQPLKVPCIFAKISHPLHLSP